MSIIIAVALTFFGVCAWGQRLPVRGTDYHIYQPAVEKSTEKSWMLLAPPEQWIESLMVDIDYLDKVTIVIDKTHSIYERAVHAYTQVLGGLICGRSYGSAERSTMNELGVARSKIATLDQNLREGGLDMVYHGVTMIGFKRLKNLNSVLERVFRDNIEGDFLESGVWRGGASIFARAMMRAHKQQSHRLVYACDSFAGWPRGDPFYHRQDVGWDKTAYLDVNEGIVSGNFRKFGVLDENVIFAKGYFNSTMVPLRNVIKKLSVLRLDGDLYQSTVDVLYNLYDKLSVGGYVIMDDWFGFPAKEACEDFFKVHNIQPEILEIDTLGVFWRKSAPVEIQYWRYEKKQFKP